MQNNECRVYFALNGDDFDPGELTQFLGMKPTSTKRKGEKIPDRVPKFSSWVLSTDNVVDECIDVYEIAGEIVKQLQPKKTLIIDAIKRFGLFSKLQVVLSISVDDNISTPAIGFDVETTKFLGEIGAFIDIDTYRH
ncbi:DUF4279 domain-containing protein [Pseudomonas sp. 9Ag]|uniref:DUF4279 domain-containing protein n=1 Tax=Pseudomonas sp. 9Ag TaxID=2653167 RepID=UPI00135ABA88|nr:DUF4279 domain-containing protein [Pseudomonas sp. 9Ag]